jgi:hypothetical protein
MDEPSELTADQVMLVVQKTGAALRALADQSLALYIINGTLLRALQKAGTVDIAALGLEAASAAANLPPGVMTHIKALTVGDVAKPEPQPPAATPSFTVIEGGRVEK